MKQQTLAMAADKGAGFEQYGRPTKRDVFLKTMNEIVPWAQLCEVIQPHYPKGEGGRPPIGLERMLRMHFVQHWVNLADEACEDALYDMASLRAFVGIDLGRERVPDATTLLKFRRLLNEHKLGEAMFAKVGQVLQSRGLKVGTGTIVLTSSGNPTVRPAPRALGRRTGPGPCRLRDAFRAPDEGDADLPAHKEPARRTAAGHSKLESTVRYLGIEVDDALEISEQTEI